MVVVRNECLVEFTPGVLGGEKLLVEVNARFCHGKEIFFGFLHVLGERLTTLQTEWVTVSADFFPVGDYRGVGAGDETIKI